MLYSGFDRDREYLVHKFRNPVFEENSGMTQEEIFNSIVDVAKDFLNQGLPKPVVKARCFEYVCNHMCIDVNPHDCFPGFGCYDRDHRPLRPLLMYWEEEVDASANKECAGIIDERNRCAHVPQDDWYYWICDQ